MNPPVVIKQIDRRAGKVKTVAWLENAHSIEYNRIANGISTCAFRLPADDPNAKYIGPQSLIEITDSDEGVGLYRISDRQQMKDKAGLFYQVTGRHVIDLLRDKLLFGAHPVTGHAIPDVIRYVLEAEDEDGNRKQTDWVLDGCDYNLIIDYLFENCTLYDGLQTITENWKEPTIWRYDTSVYPFRLSLRRMSDELGSEIRSGKNLVSLSIEDEYSPVANRYYALGTGEGINQLNLMNAEDLEQDGRPLNGHYYVQDDASVEKYGLREALMVDRSISDKPLLLMGANRMLNDYSDPAPIIKVKAADLWPQSHYRLDHFIPGDVVRSVDEELGYDERMRIWEVGKSDLTGNPGEVELVIGRPYNTVAKAIDKVYRRDQEEKRSSQGATNVWSQSFGDNCDKDHPVKITFRLPDDLLYVNKCMLDFTVSRFRAYEKGAAGGGGGTVGMTSDTSSAAGGGQTIGISDTQTSASGGGGTSFVGDLTTTAAGGGASPTTSQEDIITGRFWQPGTSGEPGYWVETTTAWSYHNDDQAQWALEPTRHATVDGVVRDVSPVSVTGPVSANAFGLYQHGHPHTHTVEIGAHSHNLSPHRHDLPDHVHGIVHTHTMPMHQHKINHEHNLQSHTHDLEYGIYEEPTLAISGVKIYVDGNLVGTSGLTGDGVDILQKLRTDGTGRVVRGRHTVEIVPSPSGTGDGLCKIDGALYIQCFVQSRGDYAI